MTSSAQKIKNKVTITNKQWYGYNDEIKHNNKEGNLRWLPTPWT